MCSESDAKIIVPLYILHTKADAISGFFGHGKKLVIKATFESKEAHPLLENIGKTLKVNQNIFDEMTKFTIKFIYGDKLKKNVGSRTSFEMELDEKQINATNST